MAATQDQPTTTRNYKTCRYILQSENALMMLRNSYTVTVNLTPSRLLYSHSVRLSAQT